MSDPADNAPTGDNPVRLNRYRRGNGPTNRTLYGWGYRCPCGKSARLNVSKRDALSCALDHVEEHGLPRRKLFVL